MKKIKQNRLHTIGTKTATKTTSDGLVTDTKTTTSKRTAISIPTLIPFLNSSSRLLFFNFQLICKNSFRFALNILLK